MRAAGLFFVFVVLGVEGAPQAVYDQKQQGESNIQVHLKDIQIIAILGDEALGDYDYDYDYSDLTIKPPAGNITLKPTTEASKPTSGKPEAATEKPLGVTEKPENNATNAANETSANTNTPDRIKVQIIQDPTPQVNIVPAEDVGSNSRAPPLGEILHYKRCANGYTRDKKGRCRRVRRPGAQLPFNLGRLASNLAARFKHSSESSSDSKDE